MQKFTTILLINDSSFQRKILQGYLEKDGFIVVETGDGLEGIRLIGEESPDLIISDLIMPGICGVELLKKLEISRNSIPVIILSSSDEGMIKEKAKKHGAVTYLSKPITRDELYNEVVGVLNKT